MAHHLYEQIPENKMYFDEDFGPKHSKDETGSARSMYFEGEAPRGYADPENVVWKSATELTDKAE